MKKGILTTLLVIVAQISFASDVLTLNNQKVFEGKVKKIKDCNVIFKADGKKYRIPATDIFSIQFENLKDPVYLKYIELTQLDTSKCMKGRFDAKYLHGKKGGHFLLGFLFGPFAVIGTMFADPTPYKSTHTLALSKNKELFTDPEYLSCYKSKAQGQLMGMEIAGWGAAVVLILLL